MIMTSFSGMQHLNQLQLGYFPFSSFRYLPLPFVNLASRGNEAFDPAVSTHY